ncbi:hypothetical protein ACRJ4W_31940 [Streptomyces sp. GLT-R25]
MVRCLRTTRDPYSPGRLAELVAALRELLLVAHLLKAGDPEPALIGALRRNHRPDGSLRLYGVCREPVIGPDDLGGVVTHLLDDDGRWYTLRDVQPGGPARAGRAGTALVAIRSFLSDHFRVSRGGLIISGATVSPEGRLLAERGVRATFAAGRPWTESAPATVFARPLAESAAVRFPAALVGDPGGAGDHEGTGGSESNGYARPLIGCDVEIAATDGEDLLVRELPCGGDAFADGRPNPGAPFRLTPAHSHPALAHTANFQQLGARPGLRIRVLGRLDPDRVTTLRALAVGPVPGTDRRPCVSRTTGRVAPISATTCSSATTSRRTFPLLRRPPPPMRPATLRSGAFGVWSNWPSREDAGSPPSPCAGTITTATRPCCAAADWSPART